MMSSDGPGKKLKLAEKLRQVGLSANIKEIIGQVYKFFGKNDEVVVGTIIGIHYTPTGDLFLVIHEGQIHMKTSGIGILKYGGKIELEGRLCLSTDLG